MFIGELFDYQKECLEFALRNPYSILALQMGLGKAQKITSKVFTPEGPVEIGSLKIGDYVAGPDGKFKKVKGVYPQGIKKIFRVTFKDGSSTLCCEDHLWNVRTAQQAFEEKPFKTIALKDLGDLKIKCGSKWAIPHLTSPINFPERDLKIPPYMLGVLIGDGSLKRGTIFTNSSTHIINKVTDLLPKKYKFRVTKRKDANTNKIAISTKRGRENPYLSYIREMGLNVLSKHKFIPENYLYSSKKQRIELLRGLIDTDGYVSKDSGTLQFTSASEKLCDDVRTLVETLGGLARKTYKFAKCQTGSFDSWTLTISLPADIIPVTKPDKLEKYVPKSKYPPSRYIDKIEFEEEAEAVCISVGGELYLTDHCIVTHNTILALAIHEKIKLRTLVICPSYLSHNWQNEIKKFTTGNIVTYFKKSADVFFPADTDIVVTSYDIAIKSECLFEWADTIIFDEAQNLANMEAKRTSTIHKYIYENSTKRVHFLTGTPIKNRIGEFYSLIALCNYNPKQPGTPFLDKFPNHAAFSDHFSYRQEFEKIISGRRIKIIKWEGFKNEEELKKWLKGIYISKRSTLGKINYKNVMLENFEDSKLLSFYNNYSGKTMGDVDEDGNKIGMGPTIKAESALRKVPLTISYVKGLLDSGEGPIIVYTDHVLSCEAIAKEFNVPAITGAMPNSQRQVMADRFQKGDFEVIAATIGAFSTGYTLTKSNFVVFNDYPWTPGDMAQAEFRINRIGQTRPCHSHRILASEVDEYILDTVLAKAKVLERSF